MNPWRERFQRWFTPAARRCPLSPNAISLLALTINAGAAALLYQRWFFIAIAMIVVGGLADAFDGIVARVQNKASRYGDFLDHFADRVSDTLLLAGWLLGNAVRVEIAVGAVIAVMLNGYAGTQLEATWRQREYESLGRGEFVLALIVYPAVSALLYQNEWENTAFASLRVAEWMALLILAFALLGVFQRFSIAAKLERSQ
ncbi:MAG TPA: CDP-alcohol phosphatidyltransferase family protein [Thermoanaerobaculia bacterium]|nr:CDP-alcohol phosphatidyltransferase family protein [Thermoanaerobaculia bacterium]